MIQRIFHPIGQGAFYSERHDNFNVVYDCGNMPNTKFSNKVVTQAFDKEEVIDILFISHFDYDHISKLSVLMKHVKKIKRVIMPLLHKDEKIFLSKIYSVLYRNFSTLIKNPEHYFGEGTKIIYVKHAYDEEGPINNNLPVQNIDEIKKEIPSGTPITINDFKDWVFIPYNHDYSKKKTHLGKLFSISSLGIDRFKEDLDYALNNRKKIKDIYNKLSGKINQNSMIVYSGPRYCNKNQRTCFRGAWNNHSLFCLRGFCRSSDGAACVYTGDANLNITKIRTIFNKYWSNVGTIQIPHHGDIKAFNKDDLKDENYYCPISVGTKNSYGHPSSKVVGEILLSHSIPVLVTEKLDSMFIEIIE